MSLRSQTTQSLFIHYAVCYSTLITSLLLLLKRQVLIYFKLFSDPNDSPEIGFRNQIYELSNMR